VPGAPSGREPLQHSSGPGQIARIDRRTVRGPESGQQNRAKLTAG